MVRSFVPERPFILRGSGFRGFRGFRGLGVNPKPLNPKPITLENLRPVATTSAVTMMVNTCNKYFCSEPNTKEASANANRQLRQQVILHKELTA